MATVVLRGPLVILSRFQAILSIQEGVSEFKIVETNDFNQLPHITLAFRPGNDAAVNSFLAVRLSEVRALHAGLDRDLSRSQVSLLSLHEISSAAYVTSLSKVCRANTA